MRCFPLRFHLKSKTISVAWLLFHKGPHLQINTLSPHNDKSLPPTAVCSTNAALKSKENWNTYSIGMTHYYVENGRSPFSTIRVKCGGRCHTGRERERGQRPVIANSLMVFSAVCRRLLTPRSGTSLTATKNSVAVVASRPRERCLRASAPAHIARQVPASSSNASRAGQSLWPAPPPPTAQIRFNGARRRSRRV